MYRETRWLMDKSEQIHIDKWYRSTVTHSILDDRYRGTDQQYLFRMTYCPQNIGYRFQKPCTEMIERVLLQLNLKLQNSEKKRFFEITYQGLHCVSFFK